MVYLQNDISGQVLYFHELGPVTIVGEVGIPVHFRLSDMLGNTLIDESYWPDFAGTVTIDIKEVVAWDMFLELPAIGEDWSQMSIFKVLKFDVNDSELSGMFTINGFSKDAECYMSDLDYLRVPENYILPLSRPNVCEQTGISLILPSEEIFIDCLATNASGLGVINHLLDISSIDPIRCEDRFKAKVDCNGTTLASPVLHVCNGQFEQYLFTNRYGGFENIPMDGVREFIPDFSFEFGTYGNGNRQISSDVEYVWSQNSGYVSKKVLDVASELLCSQQVWHLTDAGFRQIIIIDVSLQSKSDENLFSFSFKYKYAEGSRPNVLKSGNAVGANSSLTPVQMFAITESPMVIKHNKTGYPCVTVVNKSLEVVEVGVTYIDVNTIEVTWNDSLEGFVYIN